MTQPTGISPQQRSQLRRTFRKDLKAPVKLRLFTRAPSPIAIPGRDCPTCAPTQQLIEEVADASPKVDLEIYDFYGDAQAVRDLAVVRIPAILLGNEERPRAVFYGIPTGHQMAVIIETIRSMSRGVSQLNNDSRRKLRRVSRPVHLRIMVTPEEPASAEAAYLAFAMTRENANISAEAVQLRDFPDLARSLGVSAVPLVLVNELYRLAAPITESGLVERILLAGGLESG